MFELPSYYMKGITIKLPEATLRQLRRQARETGRSVAALVRERVEAPLDRTKGPSSPSPPTSLAALQAAALRRTRVASSGGHDFDLRHLPANGFGGRGDRFFENWLRVSLAQQSAAFHRCRLQAAFQDRS
jgi:hypothetical protein